MFVALSNDGVAVLLAGKMLSVVIITLTDPVQYAAYTHAIKVTVDGPREPRREFGRDVSFLLGVVCVVGLSLSLSLFLPPPLC